MSARLKSQLKELCKDRTAPPGQRNGPSVMALKRAQNDEEDELREHKVRVDPQSLERKAF